MNIAIIGAGNIGGTLAEGWAKKDHRIFFGVRNPDEFKANELLAKYTAITAHTVAEAAGQGDIILVSTPANVVGEVAAQFGDTSGKIIIDTTNAVGMAGYDPFQVLKETTGSTNVIKCFNSTGFENIRNPVYDGQPIDMFMAGDSAEAKATVRQLALDMGFGECYDVGGDDKAALLEQFAFFWINLAFGQKWGRDYAIRIAKR